jgi:type VI secretion system protein ImpE
MSTPEEALHAGDPMAALKLLQEQVRARPGDARLRVFLFQLLCVLGQWERALNQLRVATELDAGTLVMAQVYGDAVRTEALRREVFAGHRQPLVFGQPERWVALLVAALEHTAAGRHDQAAVLREEAFEAAPATPGTVNGEPCAWLADADSRLGPVLEAIVEGRYWWVPFRHIAGIRLEPPADLRDLVWQPAQFTWANGGEAVGLIPARYPGSESAADPLLGLARRSEWLEPAPGVFLGLGQRVLATDAGEYSLLELRDVQLDTTAAAA